MSVFKITEINPLAVSEFLAERFETTADKNRSAENKTERVDKHSSSFSALMKKSKIRTFPELYENMNELLATLWNTPSTRQSVMSMIRIICVDYAGLPAEDWKAKYGALSGTLKSEYIAGTDKPSVGMTFKQAKEVVSDNHTISLYFKLMCGEMPILRLGDWLNASTIDTGKNNYIDLKKKVMLRRITKNSKGDMTIKLPKIIFDEIKRQDIKGDLFGDLTEPALSLMVKRALPEMNATSRHFRTLYSTDKISKLRSVDKLKETLKISDHNLMTWLTSYQRINTPIMRLLKMAISGNEKDI